MTVQPSASRRLFSTESLGLALALLLGLLLATPTVRAASPLTPKAEPPDPAFNRLYPNAQVEEILRGYAAAFPEWVKLESLGKASEGSEMWLVTVNNPATGAPGTKPAMYVDGAIHANEVQGTETVLYLLGYLLRGYGKLEPVTELLDRATFYLVPMVNPDSRKKWFLEPSTPNYPRTIPVHLDDDRDGAVDEDGYDDLDGDGEITQMRKRVPLGQGTHRLHPKDPRLLVDLEDGELGDWVELGTEGVDNDGDGRINEDTVGYIDPNRTWGYGFEPRYVQSGASDYPLQIPETRSIALWALEHPEIAAVQSFHNTGRMILRGPGAKSLGPYPRADERVYDLIGEEGEKLLPGYRYWIIWKDLYTVYGGTTDHFYGRHGVISFTNELYGPEQDFDGDGQVSDEERMKLNDRLTHGRMVVPWKEVEHPQYGTVEVGGFRHDTGRVPEGWMLEEDCHRNASFVLFHAHHLPRLTFAEPEVKALGKGLFEVRLAITNDRAIPSMSELAKRLNLHRPDLVTVEGARVIVSGLVEDPLLDKVEIQNHRPERLEVAGVPGLSTRVLYLLLEGKGPATVIYDSLKGGRHTKAVELR
jgi:hypothetical protein